MKEFVDFYGLKGFHPLYNDYIAAFNRVNMFYSGSPFSDASFENTISGLKAKKYKREQVCDILRLQNKDSDSSVHENIRALRDENCFAVVTGQQPGLFTGPLYTIYKSITAVKLAEELGKKYPYRFVPIFWIESNDNDFDEIRKTAIIDGEKSLAALEYPAEKELKPISDIQFDGAIDTVRSSFCSALPDSEFKEETEALINKHYKFSNSPSGAFRGVMAELFAGKGLILFDPSDKKSKHLSGDLFALIIERAGEIQDELAINYKEIKNKGYQPIVNIKEDMPRLFYHYKGQRTRMLKEKNTLTAGNSVFSPEKLASYIRNTPEQFSPDVLTRPLMQDFLFPTAAYAAGPTEVCYFSQISAIYKIADIPMPVIFPRCSVSLVDNRTQSLLHKYGTSPSEFIMHPENLADKAVIPPEAQKILDESEKGMSTIRNNISTLAADIDKTLKDGAENSFNKILYQFGRIKERFTKKLQEKNGTVKKHKKRINDILLPKKQMQERTLNVFSFIPLYGMKVIQTLFKEINIYEKRHQIISID